MRKIAKVFRYLVGTDRSARFRQPKHRTLSPLLQLPDFLGRRMGFITAQARNRFTWIPVRFVRQVVYQSAIHVGMAINVLRDNKSELFFVSEHRADYSVPLYLALLIKGKPVFFFVHEMQQCATTKIRSRIALNFCRACVRHAEFYPVFTGRNDSNLEARSRFSPEKTLTIPDPHHLAEEPAPARPKRVPGTALRVGIVDTMKKEKPVQDMIDILRKEQKRQSFQLVIGAPLWHKPSWLDKAGLEVSDTSTEAQFSKYLRSLDIFVVDFVKAEYYSRPSGAVVDAGMNGCYVICPDYPVIRGQIDSPVSIGSTFSSLEEIPVVLEKAIKRLQFEEVDFQAWRDYHRLENIAMAIKAFLQRRAEALSGAQDKKESFAK